MARPTPRTLLLAAAATAAAFVALLSLAYGGGRAQSVDSTALQGFLGFEDFIVESIAALGGPGPVGVMAVALAAFALVRGRPRSAALVIVLLAVTSISSQMLKALLAYPRPEGLEGVAYVAPEAFPSGHATSTMSLAIALLIVVPKRLRPLAAVVGAGFSLAVSFSIVASGWHFPSDVAGGYLLASFWALVLLAGLLAADERWPERTGRGRLASARRNTADRAAALGLGIAAVASTVTMVVVAAAVVMLRGDTLVDYLQTHTATFAVAGALAVAAVGLLAALALASARTR